MTQFHTSVEQAPRIRVVLACVVVFTVGPMTSGCTPSDPMFAPGISDGPLPVDPPSTSEATAPQRWEHFDRIGSLEVILDRFPSRGHGTGMWHGELRGTPGAKEVLNSLVHPNDKIPAGTILVQTHFQQPQGIEIGAFAMQKHAEGYFPEGGDWEYVVMGRTGKLEARGKLERCARCHAEAAVDFVFSRVPSE